MFVDVSEIRNSPGHRFHYDLTEEIKPVVVGNDEIRFAKPLVVNLDILNTGKTLVFNGRIKGDTELVCSRCLETYPFHLDAGFTEEFCHASDLAELAESGQDTEEIHVYDGNRIKLEDIIIENIVLGIPMKSVCGENCRGLCAVCGANLNKEECDCKTEDIDPRLAVLQKYFES